MLALSLFLHLLSTSITYRKDKTLLYSRLSILIFLYLIYTSYNGYIVSSLDTGIGLYNGVFQVSCLTQGFNIFLFSITAVILGLTGFYSRKTSIKALTEKVLDKKNEQYSIIEYSLIITFIILGAVLLMSTSDLVSIFLAIELQSYGLYLLATIYRNSERSTSAGLTYFLLGGLSSCFILLGISLLYINSGTTSLDGLYIITNISENNSLISYKSEYINFSLLIMVIGFLFKVAAAPFHFWSPDVYDSIPTVVTTFVAIIPKISIFVFLLELVNYTSDYILINGYAWTYSLVISSLFSLIIGTVLGLTQSRIKRLFAFSTISHVGFILLALCINSVESIQAYLFYIMQYSVSNLNGFIILLSIGWCLHFYNNTNQENISDLKNSPVQLLSQLNGFYNINVLLALSLTITIFSFVGIPPLIGFFAKQMVLSSALQSGYIFMSLVAILTSVIGAVYYLNIIRQIFFEKYEYIVNTDIILEEKSLKYISLSSYITITISILTLIILLFMFTPQEWLRITNIMSIILFDL